MSIIQFRICLHAHLRCILVANAANFILRLRLQVDGETVEGAAPAEEMVDCSEAEPTTAQPMECLVCMSERIQVHMNKLITCRDSV